MLRWNRLAIAGAVALWVAGGAAGAVTLPPGFSSQTIVGGFDKPVAVAVLPDGRLLVTEKVGLLWLVGTDGVKPAAPILDLRAEVNKEGDRGLLDVTLHPDFAHNGWIYLLYVADDIAGTSHQAGDEAVMQRLVRYTFTGNGVDPSSRKLLFGTSYADSPAECFTSHAIGTVRFGFDGSLFVSVGDGAHWDFVDVGQDVTTNDPTCEQKFGNAQDTGSFRAQSFATLAGKILRIDPDTGLGLPSNPFYDGNAASFRSRVWSIGFKNPYRFALRAGTPGPGTLYIGDVGTDHYEEIDVSKGGENFGWPCWEGPELQPDYSTNSLSASKCAAIPSSSVTFPTWSSPHDHMNRATGGVIEYLGSTYPSQYHGAFFVADYAQSWIKVLHVDSSDRFVSVEDFATNADYPVDLEIDPATGDVLYVAIMAGEVRRLHYSTANQPPQPVASVDPPGGPPPLAVQFSSNGTSDPEGDPLTFDWDFGDGSAHATSANPTHVYSSSGNFTAKLTVRDDHGNTASATTTVSTLNSPPTARITAPQDDFVFTSGVPVQFQATASDPNGDSLTYDWDVQLIHDQHIHFDQFSSDQLVPPPFTPTDHGTLGERYSYLVIFTVTDAGGLKAQSRIHLIPPGMTNQAPTAAFTATPSSGAPPLTVSFDASSSSDPDADMLMADWDFGDGLKGTGTQVSHTYDRTGTYTAKLTVTDIVGATSSTTRTVTVGTSGSGPGGLAGGWAFDEGAGAIAHDSSGNALDGAIINGSWAAGHAGSALTFDGSTSKVKLPSSALLSVTGKATIAAWVKLADPAANAYMRIVSKKPRWDSAEGYSLSYNASKQLLEIHGSGSNPGAASGVKLDTNWHHVAAVIDGSTAHLYVDGVERTTDSSITPLVAGSTTAVIGAEAGGGSYFKGGLDDVRIYAAALTQSDVSAMMTGSAPPPPPPTTNGPVAHWAFGEGAGSIAADDVSAIPCTLSGTRWTSGRTDPALQFPGSASGACGNPAALKLTSQATVAAWVRIDNASLSQYMRIFSTKDRWDSTSGFDLSYNPARQLLELHGSGSDGAAAAGVSLGTGWHHLAAVVNGTGVRLYVDGVDRTTDGTATALVAPSAPLRLGRDGAGNFLVGTLDDLRFYGRALSPSEVAALVSGS